MKTEAAATCDETGPGDAGTPPSEITGARMSRALNQRDANLPGAGALTKWGHGMERGSWPCSCVQSKIQERRPPQMHAPPVRIGNRRIQKNKINEGDINYCTDITPHQQR